jgi:hypothetical protein
MNLKKFQILLPAAALVLAAGCSDNDEPAKDESGNGSTDNVETTVGRFVIAATVENSGNTAYTLLTAESIDEGEITAANNGLLVDAATQWVPVDNDYLVALTYNQGNAGLSKSYQLNSSAAVEQRPMEYAVSRFTSYGLYDHILISTSTGDGPSQFADENGYLPKTLLASFLDTDSETKKANDTSTGAYSLENYLGNGEYVTLTGYEQANGKLYSGVAPMGLSQYGVADGNGKWVRPGYESLVKTESGGSGSGAYSQGELQYTQYPDECYVAIFNDSSLLNPTFAHTDKISYPAGRYKSQYYQSVWAADNGDIYVFSPSYAKTMTSPLQQTSLPAGVARIPAGSTEFDSYYCNIEEQSNGCSFMRCWHAGGNYFLMQMYDRPFSQSGYTAINLAIFDATAKKLTYVSGLPEDISSIGKTVYVGNGKVYIPVNSSSSNPAIYAINPATAAATKGLTVAATEITGFGYMQAK